MNCPHCQKEIIAENIPQPWPIRSDEMKRVQKCEIGKFVPAVDREQAHRLSVYMRRVFGNGSACARSNGENYSVWRKK